jgi:hypothetical protein
MKDPDRKIHDMAHRMTQMYERRGDNNRPQNMLQMLI